MKTQIPNLLLLSLFTALQTLGIQATAAPELRFSNACTASSNEVLLSFVGDLLIHEPLHLQAESSSNRYRSLWGNMEDLIQSADVAFANLEAPIAIGLTASGEILTSERSMYDQRIYAGSNFVFNYPPEVLDDLETSGFDILSISNNHMFDRGKLGLDLTLDAFSGKSVVPVGARHSQDQTSAWWTMVDAKGFRLAYLACTEMTNSGKNSRGQLLKCGDTEKVSDQISQMRNSGQVDAIILSAHWGTEYSNLPNKKQQQWATIYVDAGVDIIVGHHPHTLQRWEKFKAKDGREALVIYSLGNYVSWQGAIEKKTTTQIFVSLGQHGQSTYIRGAVHVPLWMHRGPNRIIPMDRSDSVPREARKHVLDIFGGERVQDSQLPIDTTPEC